VNAIILLNSTDITDGCRLQDTRINYDSTRRITTAQLTIMGHTLGRLARYDEAHFDFDSYGVDIGDLYLCTILDGRDGVTKLFEGRIFALGMEQSDTPTFEVLYKAELNDYAAYLDRSVCWGGFNLTLPASDQQIIQGLLGHFCPQIDPADTAELVPVIQNYDWKNKTCRQVVDDMAGLGGGEWRVDFDGRLHYRLAADAPEAPFALSTSPDGVASFPVRVSGFKRDFLHPVNRCFVRGAPVSQGVWIEAEYADPVSVAKYGELQGTIIDEQVTTGWDAAMRAKAEVLKYAYPVESGSFTLWAQDGLQVGQQVSITEDALGIRGWYVIRSLAMQWVTSDDVQYTGQFGAAKPDLETLLRLLDQRARWKSSIMPPASTAPGSITDANIKVPPGLSASSIGSVNAGTIVGQINAGQIGSVNAGSIAGVIQAGQIGAVNAHTIEGYIQGDQIGSVNATSINGVIVTDQLADRIIDDLAKYADALRPIQIVKIGDPWPVTLPNDNFPPNSFFYYEPDGHFYQMDGGGTGWFLNDNPKASVMSFYQIGRINATSITGLIVAAQIQSILAGQITGGITAGQITSVNASAIAGKIEANQINTVNASAIQGTISAGQITSIDAGQITGYISSGQIGSINAATITIGLIQDGQIGTISGSKLVVGSVSTDKLSTTSIDVGGGGSKPGKINVYNASTIIGEIGLLTGGVYGGWFKVFGAGGTGYADAKVYTDAAGSLFIRNVDLTITSANGTLSTSPTVFDATYTSITMKLVQGSDSISLVSRGIVFYSSSSKIGSLVRSPSGSYLEMEMGAGASYILMSGQYGIRSDQGYSVGGTKVINSSGQFTGTVTGTFAGTVTGSVNTTGTVYAAGGYSGGNFTGSGVLVAGGCGASGFNPTGFNGQNWDMHFRDGTGRPVNVYKDGVDMGQVILRFRGGVLVALT
jgi:hypothetical protein